MICHWDQKILGYHFSIVQRSNKIMTDVNALTIFRKFISQYWIITSILYSIKTVMTERIWIVSYHQRQHCRNYFEYITEKSRTDISYNKHNNLFQQEHETNAD